MSSAYPKKHGVKSQITDRTEALQLDNLIRIKSANKLKPKWYYSLKLFGTN
jgi:hypothetical protein